MSVFIRKETRDGTYSYDFQFRGRRFSGGTGKTTRREALQVEKLAREQAKAELDTESTLYASALTLEAATARYWQEVGQHHANSSTTLWSLGWLLGHFGAHMMLHDIDGGKVAAMVAKRRGEYVPSQRRKDRKYAKPEIRKRVSPATVNRTVTQPLREIHRRARETWKVRVADIRWSDHLLKEPQERIREARPDEEKAIMGELDRGYDVAVNFAFLTGCRRQEIISMTWHDVDFFGRQFTVHGKGKRSRIIPMSRAIYELLWAEQGHHPEKVFTYVAKRTAKSKQRELHRGKRYPLTDSGLKIAMRRGVASSGVRDFRFHDTRHTNATRVLRKSNLRVVQELLGHADIKTTTKYAHAMKEDVRAALDAISEDVVHKPVSASKNSA